MFALITWLAVSALQPAQAPIELAPQRPDVSQLTSDMDWVESSGITEQSEEFLGCIESQLSQDAHVGGEPRTIPARRPLVNKAFHQCNVEQHREDLVEFARMADPDATAEETERRVNTHLGMMHTSVLYAEIADAYLPEQSK